MLATALATLPAAAQAQADAAAPGNYNPVAQDGAVVTEGKARFTVLTDRLIRIEWAEDGKFEDRASFAIVQRRLALPKFTVIRASGALTISTGALTLHYTGPAKPDATNLSIDYRVAGKQATWHPGTPDPVNLGGTLRTLDQAKGWKPAMPMEEGLISRSGWALVDDSTRPLFTSADFSFAKGDDSPLPWFERRPSGSREDWYFFGYGHDYKAALSDFRKVSGPIPLPPLWSLGSWWTRYWPYTDSDLLKLANEFKTESVPLDGLSIDMDWHISQAQLKRAGITDPAGYRLGWTGYSWNKVMFPDPAAFLGKLRQEGLRTNLNLHPASGVLPFEDAYPRMARAMGIDPNSRKFVPFDILDKKFAQNYLKILHRPIEKLGVDFWWLDWQQADRYKSPGVDSTFWINYVHFTDQEREGKRPLLYGRWGGLGNHRYPMGFSGDVYTSWESLAYQPYFTATAANVGYAYWNHDIGGHIPGPVEPELYTRWVQWGAYSPALRTHTAPGVYAERRIWNYPEPYATAMREAFRQRYALLPYLYTEARRTYDTGVAFLRPLYYEWPEAEEAYGFKDEYVFGAGMVVAPVVAAADPATKLARQKLWIPAGEWIEQNSGKHLTGPAVVERSYRIDETPILLRAGAILPKAPPMLRSDEKPLDPLIVEVQPMRDSATSSYTLYEDSSDGRAYEKGEGAWTTIDANRKGVETVVRVAPTRGSFPNMIAERGYQLRLPFGWLPTAVTVNGRALSQAKDGMGWRYDGARLETIVTTPHFARNQAVEIRVRRDPAMVAQDWKLDGTVGLIKRMDEARIVVTDEFPIGHPPDELGLAAEVGQRIDWHPETAAAEVDKLLGMAATVRPAVVEMQTNAPSKIPAAVARTIPDKTSPAFQQRSAEFAAKLQESVALIDDAMANLPARSTVSRK